MNLRQIILLLFVVLPGLGASALSGYYLLPEWAALDAAYQRYRQVIESPSSTQKDVLITQTVQDIHRINCFAEGVGVLLGAVIFSIGIHGMCTLPQKKS
ncbi:hypothetical protein H6F98_32195 [Microcoleus sp. FACHB-SPT15]|uniref:hypothetical protein n=1 Tax=Microcoleus sp. FACHB-SPT15 TaxID=2692830 RepID=UPI001782AA58|nr:hypothetical protein [Microcoleus sp. FACHB-SPT15]MBD1810074.1 hypothetical protein [Microcoleus sp. FACHB-SPT15]